MLKYSLPARIGFQYNTKLKVPGYLTQKRFLMLKLFCWKIVAMLVPIGQICRSPIWVKTRSQIGDEMRTWVNLYFCISPKVSSALPPSATHRLKLNDVWKLPSPGEKGKADVFEKIFDGLVLQYRLTSDPLGIMQLGNFPVFEVCFSVKALMVGIKGCASITHRVAGASPRLLLLRKIAIDSKIDSNPFLR